MWRPTVLDDLSTVRAIVEGKLSVSRFGDGEYKCVEGAGTRTQDGDPALAKRLRQILKSDEPNVLVCILDLYSGKEVFGEWPSREAVTHRFGSEQWASRYFKPGKVYGCAAITRLCHWALGDHAAYWALVRRIWNKRPVLLVSGSKKGLSSEKRLLANAAYVEPWDLKQKQHCWERYPSILKECERWAGFHQDPIVLAAVGATATVLAHDLGTRGVQCIDIGHMAQSYARISPKELPEP